MISKVPVASAHSSDFKSDFGVSPPTFGPPIAIDEAPTDSICSSFGDPRKIESSVQSPHVLLGASLAAAIARRLDAIAADRTTTSMFAGGNCWKRSRILSAVRQAKEAKGDTTPVTISDVSRYNMSALYARFQQRNVDGTLSCRPLDELERAYLERGLQKKYYATHFTNADLYRAPAKSMQLDSRRRLQRLRVAFAQHVAKSEIADLQNDDHTFFALETSEVPQKSRSRFGRDVYRVPLEDAVFKHAFGGHRDPGLPQYPKSEHHFVKFGRADHATLAQRLLQLKFDSAEDLYTRKDLIPSILLRTIIDARALSKHGRETILRATSDADFNRNINGLLRPQLLNPRVTAVPDGGFKYYRGRRDGEFAQTAGDFI